MKLGRLPMAPSLRNNRDFGTFRLAALKEITLIHAIAEVEKPLVGLARPTEALKRQQPKWNWVSSGRRNRQTPIGARIYLESLEPNNSFRLGRTEWYRSLQLDVAGLWHDGLVCRSIRARPRYQRFCGAYRQRMIELGRKSP
jgi:hypothetical protein